jgi:hypothetical protein
MFLDNHLTWKEHIRKKETDLKIKDEYWLIGRNSKLSLENKILLYKTITKPIWTHGVEILGCASKSSISIIQRCPSKILRMIVKAPWYVPNVTFHEDLNVPLVKEVIKQRSSRYHSKIEGHANVLIQPLLEPHNERRKGIGQPTYEKVILNKSKLTYRIYVILIANKEFKKLY